MCIRDSRKAIWLCSASPRSSIDYRLSKFYSFNEELSRRGLKERAQMLSFSKVVPERCV